jgi:hypothetical protein
MIPNKYLTLGAAALVALVGCTNTEGEFKAFQERYEKANPSNTGTGGGTACMMGVPEPGKADGQYLMAFASKAVGADTPVLFDTVITTTKGAMGLELKLKLQGLDACTRKDKVGKAAELGPFAVAADGSFSAKFFPPRLDVAGKANPITGNALTAEATISGSFCAPAEFLCGKLDGSVFLGDTEIKVGPGSSFTLERLKTADAYPTEIKVNCNKDLAIKDTSTLTPCKK